MRQGRGKVAARRGRDVGEHSPPPPATGGGWGCGLWSSLHRHEGRGRRRTQADGSRSALRSQAGRPGRYVRTAPRGRSHGWGTAPHLAPCACVLGTRLLSPGGRWVVVGIRHARGNWARNYSARHGTEGEDWGLTSPWHASATSSKSPGGLGVGLGLGETPCDPPRWRPTALRHAYLALQPKKRCNCTLREVRRNRRNTPRYLRHAREAPALLASPSPARAHR